MHTHIHTSNHKYAKTILFICIPGLCTPANMMSATYVPFHSHLNLAFGSSNLLVWTAMAASVLAFKCMIAHMHAFCMHTHATSIIEA